MSIPWGPALDAELAYRHERARDDFRSWTWRRKPVRHVPAQQPPPHHVSHHRPVQQFPAERVSAPLIPIQFRPNNQAAAPSQPQRIPDDGGRTIAAVGGG